MVGMSFKDRMQTFAIPPLWFFTPTLNNYRDLLNRGIFGTYSLNSLVVVICSVFVSLLIATPAAYALSRFSFKGKKDISFWILSVRMAPAIAVVIPYFFLGSFIGILDTRLVLIIAYLSFNVPFAVWMLKGFIDEIPVQIDEAAMIDGCSRFQVFSGLIVPLVANGLAATSILCLIQSWNEFTFALFLTTTDARTLPTIVTQFLTFQGVVWGEMSAAATFCHLRHIGPKTFNHRFDLWGNQRITQGGRKSCATNKLSGAQQICSGNGRKTDPEKERSINSSGASGNLRF